MDLSYEVKVLLQALADAGVKVDRQVEYDDGRGVSVFWDYQGKRHSSGGATLEEALAWIAHHAGEGKG